MLTGNVEIGNGYGVPGGGAYYAGNFSSAQMSKPSLSKLLPALWYYMPPLSILLAAF
jgi:hypothetical protein